jgi:hypothetical protein
LPQACEAFHGCSEAWFRALVAFLVPGVTLAGDAVFATGDLPSELVILQTGRVHLHVGACASVTSACVPLHAVHPCLWSVPLLGASSCRNASARPPDTHATRSDVSLVLHRSAWQEGRSGATI